MRFQQHPNENPGVMDARVKIKKATIGLRETELTVSNFAIWRRTANIAHIIAWWSFSVTVDTNASMQLIKAKRFCDITCMRYDSNVSFEWRASLSRRQSIEVDSLHRHGRKRSDSVDFGVDTSNQKEIELCLICFRQTYFELCNDSFLSLPSVNLYFLSVRRDVIRVFMWNPTIFLRIDTFDALKTALTLGKSASRCIIKAHGVVRDYSRVINAY